MANQPHKNNTVVLEVLDRKLVIPADQHWLERREHGAVGPHCWCPQEDAVVQLLGRWRRDETRDDEFKLHGTIAGQPLKDGVLGTVLTWHVDAAGFSDTEVPTLIPLPKTDQWVANVQVGDVLWLVPTCQLFYVQGVQFVTDAPGFYVRGVAYDPVRLESNDSKVQWYCTGKGQDQKGKQIFYPFLEREGPLKPIPTEPPVPDWIQAMATRIKVLEAQLAEYQKPIEPPFVIVEERQWDGDEYELLVKFKRSLSHDEGSLPGAYQGQEGLHNALLENFAKILRHAFDHPEIRMESEWQVLTMRIPKRPCDFAAMPAPGIQSLPEPEVMNQYARSALPPAGKYYVTVRFTRDLARDLMALDQPVGGPNKLQSALIRMLAVKIYGSRENLGQFQFESVQLPVDHVEGKQ